MPELSGPGKIISKEGKIEKEKRKTSERTAVVRRDTQIKRPLTQYRIIGIVMGYRTREQRKRFPEGRTIDNFPWEMKKLKIKRAPKGKGKRTSVRKTKRGKT